MDCNKEEAIRAKEIAENKMRSKDFISAHKFALRAQGLYPDLENIAQIITVCEVHCSSEKVIYGNDKDWYGILKIEHTADESTIKRQYKRLALLLHPDKNNFPGATDAFKLIGEAQRILLDSDKRKSHDFKLRASRTFAQTRPQHQYHNKNSNAAASTCRQNNNRMNSNDYFSKFSSQGQPQTQTQPASSGIKETFWTACPFCCIRYQYYKDQVNKLLQCQQCNKSFTAYEIQGHTAPSEANHNPKSDYPKKENTFIPKSGGMYSKVELKRNFGSQNGTTSGQEKAGQAKASKAKRPVESPQKEDKAGQAKASKAKRPVESPQKEDKAGQANASKAKRSVESSQKEDKAGKRQAESGGTAESESETSVDSVETLDDNSFNQNDEEDVSFRRRSSRSKQNISYRVDSSDDDDDDDEGGPKKKMKQQHQEDSTNIISEETQQTKNPAYSGENPSKKVNEDDGKPSSDKELNSDEMDDPQVYACPDPDFSDFDSIRKEDCFEVGQVWACYDDVDAMPRFYCRIAKVASPGFKLRIMWLEPDYEENQSVSDSLPISCGTFKRGNYEFTEEVNMFSHLIHAEKGSKRDRYKIYPRKGQTWALFKNYEPNTMVGNKLEYEFVEVLSDYDEERGVSVAPLLKMQGFTCLYNHTTTNDGSDSFQVVSRQLYRFSHMVPCFKMSGKEREDVPNGSFELDPASLSTNLEVEGAS